MADDIVTVTWHRAVKSETIVLTLPVAVVAIFDWLVANVKKPDGSAKYATGADVITVEIQETLAPALGAIYREAQVAAGQTAVDAERATLDGQIAAAIAAITVT